jgi:hypothetical protein
MTIGMMLLSIVVATFLFVGFVYLEHCYDMHRYNKELAGTSTHEEHY